MPHCIARTPRTNWDHSLKSPGHSSCREIYITQTGLKAFEVLSLATQNVLANMSRGCFLEDHSKCGGEFGLETKNPIKRLGASQDQTQPRQWRP